MRRVILNAIGLGGVATAIALAGLWVASYFSSCGVYWEITETFSVTLGVESGHASCFVSQILETPSQMAFSWGDRPFFQERTWHSFAVYSYDKRGCLHSGMSFPLWSAFLLSVCCAMILLRGPLRRHRRQKRNECIHCGYNLTGLPEPRCPECGEEI